MILDLHVVTFIMVLVGFKPHVTLTPGYAMDGWMLTCTLIGSGAGVSGEGRGAGVSGAGASGTGVSGAEGRGTGAGGSGAGVRGAAWA